MTESSKRPLRKLSLTLAFLLATLTMLMFATQFDPLKLMTPFEPNPPPLSKVTPETFRFEDYGRALDKKVLDKLFPAGTPKAYVDGILVDKAGAVCPSCSSAAARAKKGDGLVTYEHKVNAFQHYLDCPSHMTWYVRIHYDTALKLEAISLRGPC